MSTRTITAALAAGWFAALCTGCGSDTDSITLVSRQNNSGTYVYFREAILGKEGKFNLSAVKQNGSKDVVELVSETPTAIGYSGMGYATDGVKMLAVSKKKGEEAIAPTVENAKVGAYPLSRPLFIYTVGEPEGAAKHYLDWIQSAEGQAIVVDEGYVPLATPLDPPTGSPPAGKISADGSDTMVQIAGAWQEAYMKKYPEVKISVNGGGSGTGIASLIDGTTDLANASRDMTASEKQRAAEKRGKETKEIVVGHDALAIFVHKQNPLNSISIEELAEIFGDGGKITKWSQLTGDRKGEE